MTKQAQAFTPDWISAPGETIADLLAEKGWTQTELANRAGYTTKHVSLLINGKAPINDETALKLERVLGSTARFWLTREANFREALARIEERQSLQRAAMWLRQLPLKEMVQFNWIRQFDDKGSQVAECLRFYGVASVEAWGKICLKEATAFRASVTASQSDVAISTWLRQGERRAVAARCQPFDAEAFQQTLRKIRALTKESDPRKFMPQLVEWCAQVGVVVVIEPAPKGCPISGATKWVGEKALLMLSLRFKTDDHFWFTFFHEAGHLLLHGRRMLFLENGGQLDGKDEDQADAFARDILIPPDVAQRLAAIGKAEEAVRALASQLGIAPGIVVGRMQKDGLLPWSSPLNDLKVRYQWAHEAAHKK